MGGKAIRRCIALAIASFGASAAAAIAAAPSNLIPNGHFDGGTSPWQPSGGVIEYDPAPSPGTAGTGTLKLTNDLAYDYGGAVYAEYCINDVTPGARYIIRARVYAPAGQPRFADIFVDAQGFSGPDCGGAGSQGDIVTPQVQAGAWTDVSAMNRLTMGAQSVRVNLSLNKLAPGVGENAADPIVGYFDDIEFSTPFTTVVPGLSSDAG